MVRRWGSKYGRHVYVGVEIDGQQQLNLHALKRQQLEYNTYFSFAKQVGSPYGKEGISRRQAIGAKHEQFMRVHPLFQQHKVFFPDQLKDTPDMKEVLDELNYITYESIGSKHDDALDCISMIAAMDVMYPSVEDINYGSYSDTTGSLSVYGNYFEPEEEYSGGSTVF